MSNTHPYVASAGPLLKAVEQFRKSLPSTLNAATLKKLGLAPNNESYLINTLRFLGIVDESGQRTEEAHRVFSQHADDAFIGAFEPMVRAAYSRLFDHFGEEGWRLDKSRLVTFFRAEDSSTDIVGQRQATTFSTLARLAGHGDPAAPLTTKPPSASGARAATRPRSATGPTRRPQPSVEGAPAGTPQGRANDLGITVRVEINLPATTDQEVYDKIFQSLRKNLVNANMG